MQTVQRQLGLHPGQNTSWHILGWNCLLLGVPPLWKDCVSSQQLHLPMANAAVSKKGLHSGVDTGRCFLTACPTLPSGSE